MIPPALPTYFYQVAGGRFTAGTQLAGLSEVGQNPTRIRKTGPEREHHGDEIATFTYWARIWHRPTEGVSYPPELWLRITDFFGCLLAAEKRIDSTLPGQAITDHTGRSNAVGVAAGATRYEAHGI